MTNNPSVPQPTPRYEAVLAAAARQATELGHSHMGTEHLQLALLADSDAIATQVISRFVSPAEVIDALHEVMASESYHTPAPPPE